MKKNNLLTNAAMSSISNRLSMLVADVHQLYIKSLAYHWNVEDPRFALLHNLFEEDYTLLATNLDSLAERIRKLGQLAPSTLEVFRTLCRLQDTQLALSGDQMIEFLALDYEKLILWLREDIDFAALSGDPGTADLLTGILRAYEKRVWFLRSHLSPR